MIGLFKIGLAGRPLRSAVRAFSRLSCVLVPIAFAAVGTMVAWISFGLIFNYTHSAPFGIYREIADPSITPHDPAPYVFDGHGCWANRTIEFPCVPAQMGFRLSSSL